MSELQLSQTDELFQINPKESTALTTENEINTNMQESAQELLNHYVRIQGLNVSQVIWFNCCNLFLLCFFGGRCCVKVWKLAIGCTRSNLEP